MPIACDGPQAALDAVAASWTIEGDETAAAAGWIEAGMVFTTRGGTPFEPRNFNRRSDTRCARAGVRMITVHDTRHTCATLLAALGVGE